ncbi:MAG TPA: PspC domain-containing protein [candidate division Zixibacteria bacterium]|nr:PspC domain-containing protein [candidate division Zixibacteria bacterium]
MAKRLYRSRQEKVLAGVCGGIAEYLAVDPTVVRLAFVLLVFVTHGVAIPAYLLGWIIIPREPLPGVVPPVSAPAPQKAPEPTPPSAPAAPAKERSTFVKILPGVLLVVFGLVALGNHYWWWRWVDIFPVALILLGLYFILRQWDNNRSGQTANSEKTTTGGSVSQGSGNGGATLTHNGGDS